MTYSQPLAGGPISDAELNRLEQLLERYGHPDDGLNVEALDGYLCALVVGPALVMPSEYKFGIWGQEPEFENESDARDAHTLIFRLWNHIVWRVQQPLPEDEPPDADLVPPLAFPAELADAEVDEITPDMLGDMPVAAMWAMGFIRAVGLRADAWQAWCDRHEQIEADFARIFELSLVDPEQVRELGLSEDSLPDRDERLQTMLDLAPMLQDMYFQRLEDARPQPVRRAAAPGRNDPCPCGSGLKYKKCCGDPARLH